MWREKLDTGVHCPGALFESEVRVVEDDEADEADETIESPDEEGNPEPIANAKNGCEKTRH